MQMESQKQAKSECAAGSGETSDRDDGIGGKISLATEQSE
jgi:hypothetical protein